MSLFLFTGFYMGARDYMRNLFSEIDSENEEE